MNVVASKFPNAAARARFIRGHIPPGGLFAGQSWRIASGAFPLGQTLVRELEQLGRVLLQFYRAADQLYRQSSAGKQPPWVARLLDQGKPAELLNWQRAPAFRNDLPRVIRPDILLTERGYSITELDSVPGGIGLTAWLNHAYSAAQQSVLGGPDGMLRGFASIFGDARRVRVIVSEEAATYRPEMQWLTEKLDDPRFAVGDETMSDFAAGDAVYRFFELFDLPNVRNATQIFELATRGTIRVTPPPKAILEEKLLFALLWNRNLRQFWRQALGESFLATLQKIIPYTWVIDPAPLPPHGAIPELNLTDWHQLKALSKRERELILKISGFSPKAWGARGVYLGSDLSHEQWSAAVENAIAQFPSSPSILQRYEKPKLVATSYYDFERDTPIEMAGRVRLCPYYFVNGEGDQARATLGGILATICPADKKIIHGMAEAVLAPCSIEREYPA